MCQMCERFKMPGFESNDNGICGTKNSEMYPSKTKTNDTKCLRSLGNGVTISCLMESAENPPTFVGSNSIIRRTPKVLGFMGAPVNNEIRAASALDLGRTTLLKGAMEAA